MCVEHIIISTGNCKYIRASYSVAIECWLKQRLALAHNISRAKLTWSIIVQMDERVFNGFCWQFTIRKRSMYQFVNSIDLMVIQGLSFDWKMIQLLQQLQSDYFTANSDTVRYGLRNAMQFPNQNLKYIQNFGWQLLAERLENITHYVYVRRWLDSEWKSEFVSLFTAFAVRVAKFNFHWSIFL